ncbi:MAG: hypothetical protein JO185_25620, partial [Acidobacteriaceae bacterium]|nr:hypothetical protein [Acidobacteriaceae bacterium]
MASDRPDLKGKVVDTNGKPLEHVTVLVYSAGVKQGYSTFCPTCYADCGKRSLTGSDGTFVIKSLAPDLLFRLLAVRDGLKPTFAAQVDPVTEMTR